MKQRLDEIQQKAVTHGEGPLLVTAGPGSGKTTVITHHIKFLIDYLGVPPKEILVITFTKSAATEMKERFMRLCDIRNTEVVFGTFHAFFYQILRRSAGFQHDSLLKEKEKYTILRDILRDKKIHFYENTYLEDLLGEISQANNQNSIDKFESALVDQEIFKEVYFEYKRRKSGLHKIDFDDMVTECLSLLRSDRNILQKWQKSFRYILVDEFQDINPMQYEIVKMLAEPHHNIFAVGDEDQSVYSFRGANPKICFSFMEDYPEAKQIFLSVNYRCHKDIVEASKSLISHNRHRFKKEIKAFNCKECNYGKPQMNFPGSSVERSISKNNVKANGIEIKQFQYEQEAYEEIAKELKEYKGCGRLSECAILFRTNMISPLFIQELKKNRIPHIMKAKCRNWAENPVIKDVLAYLALSKGDLSRKNMFRIMNKPVRYISRDMITEENITWEILERNTVKYFSVLEQVKKLRRDTEYIRDLPLPAAIGYIRRGIGYEHWLNEQGGKIYQEGMEVLDTIRTLARDCDTAEELEEILLNISEYEKEDTIEDAVEIMTYHGAKGLEWPVVFLPDVLEGITPYKRAHSEEEIEEERRMFYVALTRAKERVMVYTLNEDTRHKKSPSIFIKELKGD